MRIGHYFLIAIGGAVLGAASGFAWRTLDAADRPPVPTPIKTVEQIDVLPHFSFPGLDGRQRSNREFGDKILVVNFWATWCAPCREETPLFVALQENFVDKVQFIGIAIDDEDPVREFADDFAVNYPLLLGDFQAVSLARRLGNRYEGLPFTVVAMRDGRVVLRHAGGLQRAQLEPLLKELVHAG